VLACDPAAALEYVWQFVSRCNKYVDETAPWNLAKNPDNRERLNTVLYTFVESIRILGILCAPFMPGVPEKITPLLGIQGFFNDWEQAATWNIINPGTRIKKGEPIFPRIDLSLYTGEQDVHPNNDRNKPANSESAQKPSQEEKQASAEIAPLKEEISIEEFAKMDLRVVKVLKAEKVEKAINC
jgi:methionyl-tRNA synthetase